MFYTLLCNNINKYSMAFLKCNYFQKNYAIWQNKQTLTVHLPLHLVWMDNRNVYPWNVWCLSQMKVLSLLQNCYQWLISKDADKQLFKKKLRSFYTYIHFKIHNTHPITLNIRTYVNLNWHCIYFHLFVMVYKYIHSLFYFNV